jgi:hypothetical protein
MTGLHLKYFVLNPTKHDAYGEASRIALAAYSGAITNTNPELAGDLAAWLSDIRKAFDAESKINWQRENLRK